MSELLSVKNFCVSYGEVRAVLDVNLAIKEAEIVSVIGPNGAGKSTLLNAIMGLLPFDGTLSWNGQPVQRPSVEFLFKAGIALVPEKRELFAHMPVRDNLVLGGYKSPRSERAETLVEVFRIFPRLFERQHQLAATLSGGERQMLAIGRALMSRPKVLMLDEPSLGLAPLVVREVLGVTAALRNAGVAVLLVEQNARAALQISDRGYVLELGQVAIEGKASDLARDERVTSAYLGGRPQVGTAPAI